MKKVAIRTKKGGVGKSTTTANIGFYLASRGKKVCIVDVDSQFNLTSIMSVKENDLCFTILDLIAGKNIDEVVKKINKNLYLIPSNENLSFTESVLVRRPPELMLKKRLKNIEPWDYIIFDCEPGDSKLVTNVLCYVDEVWAPLQTQALSLAGLNHLINELDLINEDFGENGVNVTLKYIIPTMYDLRTKLSREVVEYAKKEYGVIVTNPIHRSVKLEEAPGHSKTIFEYDSLSQPAKDYKILAERILSENKK